METKKIKLSVLVTFYNQEDYVDRAFDSIFRQKVSFPFEVLVGDDGSSDGTIDKVKEWQKRFPDIIRIYIQPRENRKYLSGERASGNRLSLLEHINGEYFMYLDGDDCYCDDYKFQKQVDILDANPDCSCCSHNVSFVHLDGSSTVLKTWFNKSGKISFPYYWWKGYFHPDSLMFRSENIHQNIDYRHRLFFNDNFITYVFAHMGKIYFLTDVMACYYETDNGIWNGQSKIVGWIRTVTIYEYLWNIYRKNRVVNYLRAVPLYYLILKNSNELSTEKIQSYIQIGKENNASLISSLSDGKAIKSKKAFYRVLYSINALAKRVF